MPAPISVVIPTLEAAEALPATLACLVPGVSEGLIRDLVISDGGSTDETVRIGDAAGAEIVAGPPGRGGQLARGAKAARGDWLLFLHADTQLDGDWLAGVERHMGGAPEKAGYFSLKFRATGIAPAWVAGWANVRSQALGLPYGDQGLLLPRSLYLSVGGYPDIPLMEDVALARALRGRLRRIDGGHAATSAERYEVDGWTRRGTRNLWTLARYLSGADPKRLSREYSRTRG